MYNSNNKIDFRIPASKNSTKYFILNEREREREKKKKEKKKT